MPVFSCFTAFGFLEFSSEPSECEKVYNALCAGYRDPRSGQPTLDLSVGTHKEAQIFGWANAIAAARVTIRGAANELRAETAYCLLEKQEAKFGMSPAATDTVAQRRAALAAKQLAARGPRYEAVWEALLAIFGSDLVAYRPIETTEAEAYPADPRANGPGIFRRQDAIGGSIRLLQACARGAFGSVVADEHSESNQNTSFAIDASFTKLAQGVRGNDRHLNNVKWYAKRTGSATGNVYAKIYRQQGTYGDDAVPIGEPIATSDAVLASSFGTSFALETFTFTGVNRVLLEGSRDYFVSIEWATDGNTISIGGDNLLGHAGNFATFSSGAWAVDGDLDGCFHLYTTDSPMQVRYENWNRSLTEITIVKGDVLCVDPGIWGLAERVSVIEASGTGTDRTFTAEFLHPHGANTYASTGPFPLWSNSKRHVLVVVKSAAAVDVTMVTKVNELFARIMRAPTTWAIVEPTTPGAATTGPFKIGTTLGSPLGAVPVESITL